MSAVESADRRYTLYITEPKMQTSTGPIPAPYNISHNRSSLNAKMSSSTSLDISKAMPPKHSTALQTVAAIRIVPCYPTVNDVPLKDI